MTRARSDSRKAQVHPVPPNRVSGGRIAPHRHGLVQSLSRHAFHQSGTHGRFDAPTHPARFTVGDFERAPVRFTALPQFTVPYRPLTLSSLIFELKCPDHYEPHTVSADIVGPKPTFGRSETISHLTHQPLPWGSYDSLPLLIVIFASSDQHPVYG